MQRKAGDNYRFADALSKSDICDLFGRWRGSVAIAPDIRVDDRVFTRSGAGWSRVLLWVCLRR